MGFSACNRKTPNGCGECVKIPAHSPIDCENYNDVFTVYWNLNDSNFSYDCSEVLVCGYVCYDKNNNRITSPFMLIDDSIKALNYVGNNYNFSNAQVEICLVFDSISNQEMSILNASIPNKCYVKGLLRCSGMNDDVHCCSYCFPLIYILNVADIYFKND